MPEVAEGARERLTAAGMSVCHFCGSCDTREGACEAGWIPSFWQTFTTCVPEVEVFSPVCVKCQNENLLQADGEFFTPAGIYCKSSVQIVPETVPSGW